MVNVPDITITSLETITGFDLVTGNLKFILDELQNAEIQNTQETQDITGKGGRKLSTLKRNKAVTITGTNGMISAGLLEVQTGGEFENKATEVLWADYLSVASNKATTTYKAVGTTGAEIDELYIRNADGSLGNQLEQADTAAEGKFAYAPANKELTFSGLTDGTEIVVIYKRKITADVLTNDSDVYSTKCAIYIDALGEDKCDNIYHIQIFVPKADFSGEFSLEFGDNQTVHNFDVESLAGGCVAGNRDALWTYTVFGANAADAN